MRYAILLLMTACSNPSYDYDTGYDYGGFCYDDDCDNSPCQLIQESDGGSHWQGCPGHGGECDDC